MPVSSIGTYSSHNRAAGQVWARGLSGMEPEGLPADPAAISGPGHHGSDEFARRLRSLIRSLLPAEGRKGLGASRLAAAIIDRLPLLPSPLSVERRQKKADSISVLVYAVARCRAAGSRTLVRI